MKIFVQNQAYAPEGHVKKITTPVRFAGPAPVEHPEGTRFNRGGGAGWASKKTIYGWTLT
ncbi:MAG: hypothetical protein DRH24_01760 [Deltaproteobacteria bacterium]|nr:MAG: hypothetical protein DRH24_01760 [Deltaproteobacteria bacterium]